MLNGKNHPEKSASVDFHLAKSRFRRQIDSNLFYPKIEFPIIPPAATADTPLDVGQKKRRFVRNFRLPLRSLSAYKQLAQETSSLNQPEQPMKPMKPMAAVALGLALGMTTNGTARADTFGSGGNAFTIDFVNVGNPGNANDIGSYGGVAYSFRMGTYEVSRDAITKANAVGNLGITLADMTSFGGNGVNRPATGTSWNEAARFVNWMNTSSGFSAAYKFSLQPGDVGYSANADISLWQVGDAGYNAANLYRNSNAFYFLPSENEWYKAAYYSGSGTTYFDYALQSDTIPNAVSGGASGVVYNGQTGPADVANAGGSSFYGTEAQNGNVWEWNESAFTAPNDSSSEGRAIRGGSWGSPGFPLRSSNRVDFNPSSEDAFVGFRVASIPEPSTAAFMILIPVGAWSLRRRRSRSL